jgi:ribosomal RNA-processing protein 9
MLQMERSSIIGIHEKVSERERNRAVLERNRPACLQLYAMPDSFFVSNKTRKRKRESTPKDPSSSKKAVNGKGRPNGKDKRARVADEDIDSGASEDEAIDDMDLRASDGEAYVSTEEDELETPAEKRLRLANLYLQSLKDNLGM